jgi:hypothetical protein
MGMIWLLRWGLYAESKKRRKKIWDTEGFDVTIKDASGRDMRSDHPGLPTYRYDRMAKNAMTVSEWKAQRFSSTYAGFDVDVLDGLWRSRCWEHPSLQC